jgi:hypothetical protein
MATLSYARRPAKHIQRRMVVDALRRLRAFAPATDYDYVGFGGMEFVDFDLVHRELGVRHMTSIELNSSQAARYRFNAPFSGVTMIFDRASAVLPSLLDEPRLRIVWLDYECRLNLEVLQDVGTALRKLLPGSVLIVSTNAQGPTRANQRIAELSRDVEPERVPAGATDASLARWGWAAASHAVVTAEADAEVARRSDGATFEQLFHFRYADGARMLTWGGIVLAPAIRTAFDTAKFDELAHVRLSGDAAYEIAPPVLTMREALHLNAQLPIDDPSALDADGIPAPDLESYADLYRWYPPVPAAM